jgi:16S rRNA (guanine527-N7)-methyltransferase
VQARVEDYHPGFEFAAILSRAYASLADFESSVIHLCHRHCRLMSMKTRLADAEVEALDQQKYFLESIPLNVPGINEPRSLAIIRRKED